MASGTDRSGADGFDGDNPFREVLAGTGRHGNFAVNVGLC